jgi:glycosyltransferase involved in cell wall biosynthesis
MNAVLIIPALDEQESIGSVLDEIPAGLFSEVFVVDNGSKDRTAHVAAEHGATVLSEVRRGYGSACLRALAAIPRQTEVVVFMDGDGSDVPAEAARLIEPIARGEADLVLGSRELGEAEPGSLSPHQRLGNRLATGLIRLLYRHRFTDLGPFRAIRVSRMADLRMQDRNYGWTIEMQIKALQKGLQVIEVPVSYRRRRRGTSKVSGNLLGSLQAGIKILWTVARLARA